MYEESRDTFYYIDINWDNMASAAYLAPGPSRLRRARHLGGFEGVKWACDGVKSRAVGA